MTGHGQAGSGAGGVAVSDEPDRRREAGRRAKRHRPVTSKQRKRAHRVVVLLDDIELEDIRSAAAAVALTVGGWTAEAALAAARRTPPPREGVAREALLELMEARTQVRRFGINVNQGVKILNATGEEPSWLQDAVALTTRAVRRLDAAAQAVAAFQVRSRRNEHVRGRQELGPA
jgi:hypothetical protein